MPAAGYSLTVTELLGMISKRLGAELGWASQKQIWEEMGTTTPELAGITPSALGDVGMLIRSLREPAGATAKED